MTQLAPNTPLGEVAPLAPRCWLAPADKPRFGRSPYKPCQRPHDSCPLHMLGRINAVADDRQNTRATQRAHDDACSPLLPRCASHSPTRITLCFSVLELIRKRTYSSLKSSYIRLARIVHGTARAGDVRVYEPGPRGVLFVVSQ